MRHAQIEDFGIRANTSVPDGDTTILIVDDHPLIRHGLRCALSLENRFQVTGESHSAKDALASLRIHPASIVIVDIMLPDGVDGIELTKSIAAEHPEVGILVLSTHDESLYAFRSLAAGAKGYVTKDRPLEELLEAIRTVARGEIALSKMMTQRLVQRATRPPSKELGPRALSDRELEILFWIGKGCSTVHIAERLRLSIKTIEAHRANIRRKLGIQTGAELLRYAVAWLFEETHSSASAAARSTPRPRTSESG
ncbi:MAG: hypothetical protein RLZZ399_2486 [Verrucomicrobiota bacterium]